MEYDEILIVKDTEKSQISQLFQKMGFGRALNVPRTSKERRANV